jgi:hypothetical protein
MTKFFSKPVEFDGYKFDSQMECDYYKILKEKKVIDLVVHPRFLLLKQFDKPDFDGKPHHYNEIAYEADFMYKDDSRKVHIVDVKGYPDEAFPLHRKMFEALYPDFHLEVLKYSKSTGWVKFDDYKSARRAYKKKIIDQKNSALKQLKEAQAKEARRHKQIERLRELKSKKNPTKYELKRMNQLKEELKEEIV